MKKTKLDFGRVFFPDSQDNLPQKLLFQPLGNHVSNVAKLVKHWDWNSIEFNNINDVDWLKKRVIKAAQIHDEGKPQKFSLEVKIVKTLTEITYSFKGHRFLAEAPDEPWSGYLAKGHHDFSVQDIVRDTYLLKTSKNKDYARILQADPLAYARELYILEMCDQIEAEIACKFYGDDDQAESRAFMDFNVFKNSENHHEFFLEPWIFDKEKNEIKLTLATWSMDFPEELKKEIENNKSEHKPYQEWSKKLNETVKDWWQETSKTQSSVEEIIIRRLTVESEDTIDGNAIYQRLGNNGEGFTPNRMQQALMTHIMDEGSHPAVLFKAPTGSGKTEAILLPALANRNRLILVMPTRSLIEDQSERIDLYLTNFSNLDSNRDRQFSLVIDTGSVMTRKLYKNGESSKPQNNPRRHLYKGDVILTTLDKFIYRYFAFGDKQKSFIFPHRIQHPKTLICFDEAHSYENIAFTNFQSLVKSLYEQGRSLVLMTATMPPQLLKTFDYLNVHDFSDTEVDKPRNFEYFNDIEIGQKKDDGSFDSTDFQKQVTAITLNELREFPVRRILLVVETVKDAVAIYCQLKEQWGKDNLFLYHGRIADQVRPEIYKQIKQRDNKQLPYIIVTTRAIEVGCDLNAETLITQVCSPENLIQRVGRCNRRGNVKDAKVIVVGDQIPEFINTLDDEAWQKYRSVISNLKKFNSEKIGECIYSKIHVDDYRVLETFSMLHDYVYGSDLTCEETHKKGVIPTRSWKPSVTLVFNGKDNLTGAELNQHGHSITIPIDRLCGGSEYAFVNVTESEYNVEERKWRDKPLGWGSAYRKNIKVIIDNGRGKYQFNHDLSEYQYSSELGFVDLPKIFIKLKSNDAEEKLLHINKNDREQSKVIINYVKEILHD
ncbi:CRISPR-associated helicase Cas3' [Synechocystis salina LEGE 06099]|uniref:CRISPR-associated helicase Cas3' n=1 Tax=Synechocystis salina TaxID=945780 RepID=UPI00187F9A24|nr:CRISPR-associated helicase Cas3' [Synechocystis salina]MBE9204528.1 CRISPR-associated helicase Cas3' [Synechocystis salina LEGE 06099]